MRGFVVLGLIGVGCNETQLRARVSLADVPWSEQCAAGVEPRTVSVAFPARQDCPFNEGDNLERRNEHNQARVEEVREIALDGAVVCSLRIASRESAVFFDDHLALLLDDVVLVAGGSGLRFDEYPVVDGLPRFEWPNIAGTPFGERYAPYGCLGGGASRCDVPRTEETGRLDVDLAPDALEPLAASLEGIDAIPLSLITFGDDDGGDCAHSDVTLEVELSVPAGS